MVDIWLSIFFKLSRRLDLTKPKKIIFKKPEKSSQEKKSDLIVSSTKRSAEEDRIDHLVKKHSGAVKDNPNLKKTNLLSFTDEDEEESWYTQTVTLTVI